MTKSSKKKQRVGGDVLRKRKLMQAEMQSPGPMQPELKYTVKKMIRDAIKQQNKKMLFTCRDCCFYVPRNEETHRPAKCELNESNQLVMSKRMPTQLPSCFLFNPIESSLLGVLTLMYSLGIDTIKAEHGWATICGRLATRQDRYGFMSGVKQKNLERYG